MKAALAIGLAGVLGAVGAKAGAFAPPEGCKAYLSVQSRGCTVSHYYTCEADPQGNRWRIDYDGEGPYFQSLIDHEGQWLRSRHLVSGVELSLLPGSPDPASISQLISEGYDSYEFLRSAGGAGVLRVKGYDRLTGAQTTIHGVVLAETEFAYAETTADGAILSQAQGREYFHAQWRLFFAGLYETEDGPMNRAPARFDLPGDRSFLSDTPEYDCADQMAAYAPLRTPLIPAAAFATPKE